MKTAIQNFFSHNWQRKGISLILAVIIWLVINHSLTTTKTLSNVPVRIINVPSGKTVEGMQSNGLLTYRMSLTLTGNKNLLDELTSNDVEIVIDATDKQDEWSASITKKNLISLNQELDITKGISRMTSQSLTIRLTKLITEKIPILITPPIGEAPRDYQFLDVWPYHLTLTISGPEEVVKHLKTRGQKLTFNLNNISKAELDAISAKTDSKSCDEVSFFVPDQWKQVSLPLISDTPIEINDPQARALRIDFVRCSLLSIDKPLPVTLFFPPEFSSSLNPANVRLKTNSLIIEKNGIYMIAEPLFAKGVDRLFMHLVRDMIEIVIIVSPSNEGQSLKWSVQFINPRLLEDRYVATLMSDVSEEAQGLEPAIREEYWRNRFRSYMNRFQLYHPDDSHFELDVELKDRTVIVKEAYNS